jgi:transitional endoplasmic reticulum ATPase
VQSQWTGKAPKAMAAIIHRARVEAPCIIFFDEGESLLGVAASGSSDTCVVNEFKASVDPPVLAKEGVIIICATNHLSKLDKAVRDRLGEINIKVLPELTVMQRVQLVERELPESHGVTQSELLELVKGRLAGAGLRSLKFAMLSAVLFAEKETQPLDKRHIERALDRLERAKADATKQLAAEEAEAAAERRAAASSASGSETHVHPPMCE